MNGHILYIFDIELQALSRLAVIGFAIYVAWYGGEDIPHGPTVGLIYINGAPAARRKSSRHRKLPGASSERSKFQKNFLRCMKIAGAFPGRALLMVLGYLPTRRS